MGVDAGSLRDRITFKRASVSADDYGGEIETWTEIGQRWANVNYGKGQERREAAQINATIPATFRVRRDTLTRTIGAKDQIEFDGGTWNIVGAPVMTPDRDTLDIAAVRGV
jgi:SPP1 family predicted phage head-tail adaptor